MSQKLHYSTEEPETLNNFCQKSCSVSAPLDTQKLVLTSQPNFFRWIPISFWSTFKIDDKSAIQKHFSGNFFGRPLMLQFWQTCHFFSIKRPIFSAQSPKNWKKQFFKVKFPQMFPLNACIAVLAHLDSLFATEQKKLMQIQISNKKHGFSGKRIDFPQNFPVDARMAFVTTLKKFFWIKLLFFLSQIPRKIETMCKVSNMFFSSKSSKAT